MSIQVIVLHGFNGYFIGDSKSWQCQIQHEFRIINLSWFHPLPVSLRFLQHAVAWVTLTMPLFHKVPTEDSAFLLAFVPFLAFLWEGSPLYETFQEFFLTVTVLVRSVSLPDSICPYYWGIHSDRSVIWPIWILFSLTAMCTIRRWNCCKLSIFSQFVQSGITEMKAILHLGKVMAR